MPNYAAHSQHANTDVPERYDNGVPGVHKKKRPVFQIGPDGLVCGRVTWVEFDAEQLYEQERKRKREPVDPAEIVWPNGYAPDAHNRGLSWMEAEPQQYAAALANRSLYRKPAASGIVTTTVTPRAA